MAHCKHRLLLLLAGGFLVAGLCAPAESATLGWITPTTTALAASDARCAWDEEDDTRQYRVVVNHEEQYSIWPADRENAAGWNDVGKTGTRQECLEYIEQVWTDMRPLSLRKKMEEEERAARGE